MRANATPTAQTPLLLRFHEVMKLTAKQRRALQDLVIEFMHDGHSTRQASALAGLRPSAVLLMLERDERFSSEMSDAADKRAMWVKDAIFETACKGSITAQRFYLMNDEAGKDGAGGGIFTGLAPSDAVRMMNQIDHMIRTLMEVCARGINPFEEIANRELAKLKREPTGGADAEEDSPERPAGERASARDTRSPEIVDTEEQCHLHFLDESLDALKLLADPTLARDDDDDDSKLMREQSGWLLAQAREAKRRLTAVMQTPPQQRTPEQQLEASALDKSLKTLSTVTLMAFEKDTQRHIYNERHTTRDMQNPAKPPP